MNRSKTFKGFRKHTLLKKAFFMGLFTDMLGWFIFFVGMLAWFIIFSLIFGNVKYDISSQGAYLEDKSLLINILETPVTPSTNIADEIIISISNNKDSQAKEEIDKILNSIYGRADKVCWALWYYEGDFQKNLMNVECTGKKQQLFNQEVSIPQQSDKDPIKIRLSVLGYRK